MTEEEQATLAYIKLQDDVEKLIKNTIFNALTNNNEDGDPIDDILRSLIINIICTSIEDKPLQFDIDTNPYQRPQFKLQEAILKLVHPHRS